MTQPPVQKLLADLPNIPGVQLKKTLILNLEGTIICQMRNTDTKSTNRLLGSRVIKRPGLDLFLARLS